MKKLNRKGYLTVEVILASTLAFIVAFFLIDITMKLSQKTDDAYVDTVLVTNKVLFTKKIMDDVSSYGGLKSATKNGYNITLVFADDTEKTIEVDKENGNIGYGDYTQKMYNYQKIGEIIFNNNNSYIFIKIPITTIYSNYDYGIEILFSTV